MVSQGTEITLADALGEMRAVILKAWTSRADVT